MPPRASGPCLPPSPPSPVLIPLEEKLGQAGLRMRETQEETPTLSCCFVDPIWGRRELAWAAGTLCSRQQLGKALDAPRSKVGGSGSCSEAEDAGQWLHRTRHMETWNGMRGHP